MTTEAAILGTPAICISSWAFQSGNLLELKHYKLGECFSPDEIDKAIQKAISYLKDKTIKEKWKNKKNNFLSNKINVSSFLIWFIENYPKSRKIMKENPDFQNRFI